MKLRLPIRLTWPVLVGLSVGVVLLLAVGAARFNARGSANAPLISQLPAPSSGAKTLIVLVHGYASAGSIEALDAVKAAALEAQPGADVLSFGYAAQLFSNASPFQLAYEMNSKLEEVQATGNYDRIILCGYSMGALLIRKAYVYGCGSLADSPVAGSQATTGARMKWVDRVDRFVLLAGMNRGFSLDPVVENRRVLVTFLRRVGIALGKWSGTGRLPRECMRGEPFVANLRLQWLDVMREARKAGRKLPRAIQLLGLKDDVVGSTDSRDVTVSRDFIWVPVTNTGHADMIRLGDTGTALERKRKVALAFDNEETLGELQRLSPVTNLEQDEHVKTVVFVLHGIRDMGEWTSKFSNDLHQEYAKQSKDPNAKLHVHSASYGHFGMGPFLLRGDRQKNVRWFMDEVTDLIARFPNLEEIHFIGHSNGTYVVASALEKYRPLKINRAVLAGCVLRRDYKWSDLTGRIGGVRHYVGADDWVVGLLPKLFELPLFNLFNKDIGGAGFDGFTDGSVKDMETYFVWGGHGGALADDNVPSVVEYIIKGTKTDIPGRLAKNHPPLLAFFSNICWVLWIVGVPVILLVGWYLPHWLNWIGRKFSGKKARASRRFAWIFRAGYVVFLLLLLKTL